MCTLTCNALGGAGFSILVILQYILSDYRLNIYMTMDIHLIVSGRKYICHFKMWILPARCLTVHAKEDS